MDDCKSNVPSPDNKFFVSCSTNPIPPNYDYRPLRFTVNDFDSKQLMVIPLVGRERIYGLAWAPDSKAIAVLVQDERYGKGPLDLLSGFAGHPVPYANYGVKVYAMDSRLVLSVPNMIKNLSYGWGSIQWTPQ